MPLFIVGQKLGDEIGISPLCVIDAESRTHAELDFARWFKQVTKQPIEEIGRNPYRITYRYRTDMRNDYIYLTLEGPIIQFID